MIQERVPQEPSPEGPEDEVKKQMSADLIRKYQRDSDGKNEGREYLEANFADVRVQRSSGELEEGWEIVGFSHDEKDPTRDRYIVWKFDTADEKDRGMSKKVLGSVLLSHNPELKDDENHQGEFHQNALEAMDRVRDNLQYNKFVEAAGEKLADGIDEEVPGAYRNVSKFASDVLKERGISMAELSAMGEKEAMKIFEDKLGEVDDVGEAVIKIPDDKKELIKEKLRPKFMEEVEQYPRVARMLAKKMASGEDSREVANKIDKDVSGAAVNHWIKLMIRRNIEAN